jgi:hypothetical protein
MFKTKNPKHERRVLDFRFVSDFDIRISDFYY